MIGSVCSHIRVAHILELYTLRVFLYWYNLVREKKRVFTVLGYKLFWELFQMKYIFLYIYLCW